MVTLPAHPRTPSRDRLSRILQCSRANSQKTGRTHEGRTQKTMRKTQRAQCPEKSEDLPGLEPVLASAPVDERRIERRHQRYENRLTLNRKTFWMFSVTNAKGPLPSPFSSEPPFRLRLRVKT